MATKIIADYNLISQRTQRYVVEHRDKICQTSFKSYMKGVLGRTHAIRLFNILCEKGAFVQIDNYQHNRFTKTLNYLSPDKIQILCIENNIFKCNNPKKSGPPKGSRTLQLIERINKLEKNLLQPTAQDPLAEIIRLSVKIKDSGLSITIKDGKVTIC